jgi:hypothetical protein
VKSGGLANEDEKSHLKGILGIVGIVQEPAANAEDHRPMATDQLEAVADNLKHDSLRIVEIFRSSSTLFAQV